MHVPGPTKNSGGRKKNNTTAQTRTGSRRVDGITPPTSTTPFWTQTLHERKSRRRIDGQGQRMLMSGRRKLPNDASGRSRRRISRPLTSRTHVRGQAGPLPSSLRMQRVGCMETGIILTGLNQLPTTRQGMGMFSTTSFNHVSQLPTPDCYSHYTCLRASKLPLSLNSISCATFIYSRLLIPLP